MTNDEYYGAIRNRSNGDELHSRLPPSMISYAASQPTASILRVLPASRNF